jgi:hypothetical protein
MNQAQPDYALIVTVGLACAVALSIAVVGLMQIRPRLSLRNLRIAFSALCLTVCVSLIGLWVRSYYSRDMTRGCIGGSHLHLSVTSLKGEVAIAFDEWIGDPHAWMFESVSNSENMIAVFSSVTGKPPVSWVGFRWQFKPSLVVIVFPFWIVVLTPATFTVIPWLHWKRRFSLRTLLIATTLVAAVLGAIVWATR